MRPSGHLALVAFRTWIYGVCSMNATTLPAAAQAAIEAAFLRILRARHGTAVHSLRDHADTVSDRPATSSNDDSVKASA